MTVKHESLTAGQLYNLSYARDHAQEAAHMVTTIMAAGVEEGSVQTAIERLHSAISYLEDVKVAH